MSIVDWRPTAAANQELWKENVTKVKDVNDSGRAMQAALRQVLNDLPWVEYGKVDGPGQFSGLSGNQISFPGANLVSTYSAGRQIKIHDPATLTTYLGKISRHTYTNGGNNVLDLSLTSGGTLPVTTGLRVWLYVVNTQYIPSLSGGTGELLLSADGTCKLRVDGSGLEFWFDSKCIVTVASDGVLIGKKSRGVRVSGHFLSTTEGYQVVSSSGAAITVAREVANSGAQAVRMITVVQNGAEMNGGLNTTGNGNILWYNGEPKT